RMTPQSLTARAAREQHTIHEVVPEGVGGAAGRYVGRTLLAVPLIQAGITIGILMVTRSVIQRFSDREVALLETFADQAVIAIENARLFEELERRNHELGEALEQQTATAEVLRVIASSPTDVNAVLDAIAEAAVRVCGAYRSTAFRREGD